MGGFGDLPVAGGGGNMAGNAATAPPQPSHGGGFLGSLYDHTLRPVVNTIAGGVADIPKIATSQINLARIAGDLMKGDVRSATNVAHQQYKNLNNTNFVKNYTAGQVGSSADSANLGKSLEIGAGKTAGNVSNILAFTPMGGAIKGANAGTKLLKAGALGAGFGATQGASNEMAQGGSLDQVGQGALAGGLAGAATGAALHGTGMAAKGVFNKLTGKSADVGPTGANGFMGKTSANKGKVDAQNINAKNAEPFVGAQRGVNNAGSYDKAGLPVGHQQVNDALRILNMTSDVNGAETSNNMQALHDLGTSIIGEHLDKAANSIAVDASSAAQKGMNAVADNQGFIGGGKNGAAEDTRQQIRVATKGLGTNASVNDVRGAISALEGYIQQLSGGVQANERTAIGQTNAYQAVVDHLNSVLDANRVDKAVADYQMTQADRNALIAKVGKNGGSPELANYLQNVIDNGASFASQRTAMQIPVVAGKLARAARLAESNRIPEAAPTEGGSPTAGAVGAAGMVATAPHTAPYAVSRMLAQGYNSAKGKIAQAVNPGAYQGGLEAGLAPNDATAARINVGEPQPAPPPDIVIPGMPATPGSPETPTTIQFPQTAGGSVQLPVKGAQPAAAGIPAGTTLSPANGYHPTLDQLNMTKPQLAAQSVPMEGATTPGEPAVAPTPGTPDQVIPSGPPPAQMAAGGTPPPPPPGAGGPAGMLSQLAGNAAAGGASVLAGGLRNTLAGQAGIGAAQMQNGQVPAQQAGGTDLSQLQNQIDQIGQNAQSDTSQQQPSQYPLANEIADIQRDPKNASTYETLYKDLLAQDAGPKATAAQTASAQAITDGYAALSSAITQLQGMGGTGPQNLPGEIPLIGGLLNKNVSAYERTRIDLATSLAKALTGRSAVPKSMVDQYMNSIPGATTPSAKAQQMLQNLKGQLDERAKSEAILNPAAAQLTGGQ